MQYAINSMKTVIIDGNERTVHDQFEYFQPNTHRDGDCVIRALCKGMNWEWKKAYCYAFISTIKDQRMPNCKEGEKIIYKSLNWVWHSHNTRKPRPSVAQFAAEHPTGTYVLLLSNHHVCVSEGSYWDTWDCGRRKIYGYWQKPEENEHN